MWRGPRRLLAVNLLAVIGRLACCYRRALHPIRLKDREVRHMLQTGLLRLTTSGKCLRELIGDVANQQE
jgi:hypothetical protein